MLEISHADGALFDFFSLPLFQESNWLGWCSRTRATLSDGVAEQVRVPAPDKRTVVVVMKKKKRRRKKEERDESLRVCVCLLM